jgi:hypothetical protein
LWHTYKIGYEKLQTNINLLDGIPRKGCPFTSFALFSLFVIITRTSHLKNVSCVSLGRVLAMMGYESGVVKRHHGYYLERRKDEEVHALPHVLAYEGRHGIRQNVTDDTDGF